MKLPSITVVVSVACVFYIIHSVWSLGRLFTTLQCSGTPCFTSYLKNDPKLQVALFASTTYNPISAEVIDVGHIKPFDYKEPISKNFDIKLPAKTRKNGTLFLHVVLAVDDGKPLDFKHLQRDGPTVIQRVALTEYVVPKAATFNLLDDNSTPTAPPKSTRPVTHIKPSVSMVLLTDDISMSIDDVPPDMAKLVRISKYHEFLPILQYDFLRYRINDLVEVSKNTSTHSFEFNYRPITIGRLRLILHVEHAMSSLEQLGFTKKDVDEVKGIFSDTNLYLLCGTVLVGTVHLLFDFLSFKNDVSFWRQKKTYAGLSMRTTLWRAFSQLVIFFYLLDQHTSMLVLIPAGIGAFIELWKCKKILRLEITMSGIRLKSDATDVKAIESSTQEADKEAMRYLSYLLYPLCIAGAIYSLLYQPHKSWYSWTLNSLVNGVYAFGFLFMLPQLFINYKLKSVAALPWRAFTYKAFNTFIDDIFAFIITMPTAHRLACFRDDVVFAIYLYQRWLYPVDKKRIDDGTEVVDAPADETKPLLEKKTE